MKETRGRYLEAKEQLRDLVDAEKRAANPGSSPSKTTPRKGNAMVLAGKKRKAKGGSPKAKRRKSECVFALLK